MFHLEATDGSGSTPLTTGETAIGRGPFLGIADKRVSRNHALLEVVDDKLRIKPVHVNPCFYQKASTNSFSPLERDKWHWLHNGDCFSLLPDKYIFRIITAHSAEILKRDSEDEGVLSNDPQSSTSAAGISEETEKPSCSVTDTSKKVILQQIQNAHTEEKKIIHDGPSPICKEIVDLSRSTPRKRVLPDWMLQGDLKIQSLSSPDIKAGTSAKRRVKRENVSTNNTEEHLSERKRKLSPDNKLNKENILTKKKNIASLLEPKASAEVSMDTFHGKTPINSLSDKHDRDLLDEDMDLQNNEEHDTHLQTEKSPSRNNEDEQQSSMQSAKHLKPHHLEISDEDDQDESSSTNKTSARAESPQGGTQTTSKRQACIYGDRCYRKNPVHFQEFCHPGDSDYCEAENGSQDDSDDRPECPYGTDCYRQKTKAKTCKKG
ncbi:aprataxin and PNK-like factor isoform X2 [Bombina bombina]|uniref:aprataxin and PNK-like factor isoform X2 n=1 Tax=Bombina bombina TaxID=8345 RepID=UPI00235A57F1|nr:aprataxin and PNK-like factor isoform X2 [Bombina bombina]